MVAAAAAALSVVIGSAPAQAGLVGATVQSASYLNVPFPPPAASPTECTIIDCNILDYQGPSGPTNSPLPIVPVTYLEDALTETTVSVGDTQITILNNAAGLFCPSGGCTPGDFSGYVFTFTGAPDITNVTVGSGTSSDFQPVAPPTGGVTPGLTWTTNSITVNVAGDNLAVGDQLILDVTSGSFSFTRTVSGNWTDTTGWTPNGVPNGATVTAQLVNPASGTNNVNLGGGTFTVNQLQFSGTNAGTWDVTNGTIVFDGTNPTFLNQGDSSGLAGSLPNLTLNATTTFEIDNASALTDVTGDITGAGGLIKTGAGTLTLTGTNTYAGGTTISAGTLQIGNGGTAGSIVGNVLDNSALAFDRSDNVTFGGVISGTGSLTQLGAGTLTLTGANAYTGGTTISAGTLQIGNGGTTGSIVGNVLDNSALAFDRSNNVTFGGVISGTGSLTQLGAGTLTLTGANTYTGGTTISAGTLQIGNGGTTGSVAGNVADNGALAFDRRVCVTFGGVISGSGSLAQLGGGTLTLTGANTYTGGTTISAGTLQIGGAGSLGGGSYAGAITDDGTLQYSSSASQTLSGVISGAGALTKDTSTSTLTLTGANAYTGGTTISAGTLQIGTGGTTGSLVGNVADDGALAFDRSDNVTFSGVVSGAGSLTQLGTGTLTLTGANTFTGATTIASGTLALSGTGSIASSSGVADNGTFDISGTTSGASIMTLSGSGTVALGTQTLTLTNQSSTFAGVIGGSGGLALTGAGTETLTGANTFAGGTTIAAGALQIGAGGTTGSIVGNVLDNSALAFDRSNNVTFGGVISGTGSLTQLGAGTLTLTGANTYTGGTTISAGTLQIGNGGTTGSVAGNVADNGALAFDRSDSDTFGGVISGSGSLAQLGGGTLTLTGANTYTGGTTISAGTLQLGAGGTSGSIVGNVADNGVLAFDRSDSVTFGGVISGTGRVLQEGAGATILTSANSYSGGTTVVNGTLGVGANGALGTGSVELFTDATLAFTANGLNLANAVVLEGSLDPTIDTGANTDTISGVISGPGALTKTGSGALILTGADTYSGATTVAAGTLIVNGSIAASSSLTLRSGATLGGAGTVGGFVLPSGATIAPGALIPYSTLHVAGGIGFLAGSTYVVDVNAAGRTDAVAATGKATLSGGTVDVLAAPGVYSPSTRYTILTALGGVSGTFASLTTTSNLAFLTPALSYDPDDVFLGFSVKTVTTPPTAPTQPLLFPSVAQTPNQIATATALSAQPMGSPLFNAVIGQTVPGALAAFDALSGEIHASAVSAAFDDQRLPREAVFDRLATPYGGALAGGAQSVQTLAAPNPAQVFSAWGQAFDSWGHIGGDSNAATLSNNLGGLIFGADATLQGRYRLGVAGGYDYSTLGLGARSSSGNVSTTYVGLYGGLSDGALQLRGGGFYGYNHYGTSRTAVFPGFADTLGSGYGGDTWQGFAEAGWRMPVGGLAAYSAWAEPFVGLTGLEIATRSFGESAGAAALNGASAAYNYGITTLGLRGEASLFAWTPLVANGMIGWQRAFGDVTPNSVLAFASAPDVPFAIAGAPIARNALAVEAGVDWRFTANVKLGIYYSGLIASNASDNAIKVKLEANF